MEVLAGADTAGQRHTEVERMRWSFNRKRGTFIFIFFVILQKQMSDLQIIKTSRLPPSEKAVGPDRHLLANAADM
jgi:hypothetical protein